MVTVSPRSIASRRSENFLDASVAVMTRMVPMLSDYLITGSALVTPDVVAGWPHHWRSAAVRPVRSGGSSVAQATIPSGRTSSAASLSAHAVVTTSTLPA